jgi:hypothetical protein
MFLNLVVERSPLFVQRLVPANQVGLRFGAALLGGLGKNRLDLGLALAFGLSV